MSFNPTRHSYAVAVTGLCVTETDLILPLRSPVQPVNYIKRLAHVGCAYMSFVGVGVPNMSQSPFICGTA